MKKLSEKIDEIARKKNNFDENVKCDKNANFDKNLNHLNHKVNFDDIVITSFQIKCNTLLRCLKKVRKTDMR